MSVGQVSLVLLLFGWLVVVCAQKGCVCVGGVFMWWSVIFWCPLLLQRGSPTSPALDEVLSPLAWKPPGQHYNFWPLLEHRDRGDSPRDKWYPRKVRDPLVSFALAPWSLVTLQALALPTEVSYLQKIFGREVGISVYVNIPSKLPGTCLLSSALVPEQWVFRFN